MCFRSDGRDVFLKEAKESLLPCHSCTERDVKSSNTRVQKRRSGVNLVRFPTHVEKNLVTNVKSVFVSFLKKRNDHSDFSQSFSLFGRTRRCIE